MTAFQTTAEFAQQLDQQDPLKEYREQFYLPQVNNGETAIYLCGNSLGLQPKTTAAYLQTELEDWAKLGVEGHFHARYPWMPYHELVTEQLATLVGAQPQEVVAMNTLTVNLHLMMVSFYRPTKKRYKILIEAGAFPSDQYAVQSQLRFHGFDPKQGLIEIAPEPGEDTIRTEKILELIATQGDSIALILLGGVNYLTGQVFDMPAITAAGHDRGCLVGFDLAHAAGNVLLNLHDWQVDFAVWCSYKYLNAGPGGIAASFVHQQHLNKVDMPRFEGWWGHDKSTRFKMPATFQPTPTADAWQLSNPGIFQLAALRASLDIFSAAGMPALRQKSEKLTAYLALLLEQLPNIKILTPSDPKARGSQLSLQIKGPCSADTLLTQGVICDFREPDVIRAAPVALYNRYQDVYEFVKILSLQV